MNFPLCADFLIWKMQIPQPTAVWGGLTQSSEEHMLVGGKCSLPPCCSPTPQPAPFSLPRYSGCQNRFLQDRCQSQGGQGPSRMATGAGQRLLPTPGLSITRLHPSTAASNPDEEETRPPVHSLTVGFDSTLGVLSLSLTEELLWTKQQANTWL